MHSILKYGPLYLAFALTLTACSLDASKDRIFDPDAEFAKLDSPDVPTVGSSLEKSAVEALENGQNQRALSYYEQLHDKDEKEARYQLGLAEALRRLGYNDDAVSFYDMVIAQDSTHVDAHEGKALALMAMGKSEDAGRLFSQIMERDATRWRTLNALGLLFVTKNMYEEGRAYFNEALRHSPNNVAVMNNIGLTQAIMKDYRPAILSLESASRAAEGMQQQQVDMNLAMVMGVSGDMESARKIASKHVTGAALDNNLGLYAHLANNDELAKSYLNMALSGSTTYYKRAWKNLDIINQDSHTEFKPELNQKSYKVQ